MISDWIWTNYDEEPINTVVIYKTDTKYMMIGTYTVAVYVTDFNGDIAQFGIQYMLSSQIAQLHENIPITDSLEQQTYKYYFFALHDIHTDVKIALTAINGDPDLYVSINENSNPTKQDRDVESTNYGSDSLTLNKESLMTICDQYSGATCTIYIGVYAYESSRFSL
jgi:hypothetical protein